MQNSVIKFINKANVLTIFVWMTVFVLFSNYFDVNKRISQVISINCFMKLKLLNLSSYHIITHHNNLDARKFMNKPPLTIFVWRTVFVLFINYLNANKIISSDDMY